jgi:hypothetical protein
VRRERQLANEPHELMPFSIRILPNGDFVVVYAS